MLVQRRAKLRKKRNLSVKEEKLKRHFRKESFNGINIEITHIKHTQTSRSAGLQKGETSMGNETTLLKKPVQRRAKRSENRPVLPGKDVEEISKKEIPRTKYRYHTQNMRGTEF
ncbi:hypothetical protein TNCV_4384091 [Trichonephila clavipes]|nr:hypothetical protein TNCV_4384091 [Trichonephila clavipes]